MTRESNTAVRKALAALRAGTHLKVMTFARVADLNQQTVRRVEDVKGLLDYTPSYEVVSKWLTACKDSRTAEQFLAQYSGVTYPDRASSDTVPAPTQPLGDTLGAPLRLIHSPQNLIPQFSNASRLPSSERRKLDALVTRLDRLLLARPRHTPRVLNLLEQLLDVFDA